MSELVVAFCLILLNGLFALSELAVVSARKPRLKAMAEARRRGAKRALRLAEEPGRFLSTVQIGITLVGVLAGAFSGAALSERLSPVLEGWGLDPGLAGPLAYALVLGGITYLSVIVGELVPKQLALKNAEGIACAVAPLMGWISRVAAPVVWLFDASARGIFALVGIKPEPENAVTDEEIRTVVAEAQSAGVIEPEERRMLVGVMRLADRPARGLLTPRSEVDWVDLADEEAALRALLMSTPHSRLPVVEGGPDKVVGVVQVRAVLADLLEGKPLDVRAHVRPAPIVPDTVNALDVLEALRGSEVPMAIVFDEFGHFEGVITPADALLAITGEFRGDADGEGGDEPAAVRREDGSWLLSGWMAADEMADTIGLALPPEPRGYQTLAGFLLSRLRRIPATGERVEALGFRFEIVDLDGRRIDKVVATPLPRVETEEDEEGADAAVG